MQFDFTAFNPVDFAVSEAIQGFYSKPLDLLFGIITLFGNPAIWILVAALIYWKGNERGSFFLMNLIVFSAAIVAFAKAFFERLRPSAERFRVVESLVPKLDSTEMAKYSFPSGHSTTISSILFYFKKISKNKKIFLGILLLLVGISRIYLGMHFLSDVIAGVFAGFLIGNANGLLKKIVEKKELKLTKLEEEVGFIAVLIATFIAIIYTKTPTLALTVLGYYAGFFLLKEIGFDQKNLDEKKFRIKAIIGMAGLGLIVGALLIFPMDKIIELPGYFLSGFWISFIWPILWQKASKS